MSQTAEKFASIDTQLHEAKQAWEAEKRALQDHIVAKEQEVALLRSNLKTAVEGRMTAEADSGRLHALFAVVRFVLNEAENGEPARKPGLTDSVNETAIRKQLEAVDLAISKPSVPGGPVATPVKPGDANNV